MTTTVEIEIAEINREKTPGIGAPRLKVVSHPIDRSLVMLIDTNGVSVSVWRAQLGAALDAVGVQP